MVHMRAKKCIVSRKNRVPLVMLIWDGFGISKREEGNATALAKMPTWHRLLKEYPNTTLRADGEAVGLPKGQVGNSEAGHMTIGSGRPVDTDVVRINEEIKKKTFHDNPALLRAVAHVTRRHSTLHMMGLLTNRSSGHSYPDHLTALLKFVEELHVPRVILHLFTDGRDTSPHTAPKLLADLEKRLPKNCSVGTIIGRYYAMDRNRFWERTERAYNALVLGEGLRAPTAMDAVNRAYNRGESDEFIQPTVIGRPRSKKTAEIRNDDAVIFWNLRSDRARQLTKPFVQTCFEKCEPNAFVRKAVRKGLLFVTLTEFGAALDNVVAAYTSRGITGTLVEALRSESQYYVAESEKYVHITYFLNGGYDRVRFGEHRVYIPTHRVERYDEKPEMRAKEIAKAVVKALGEGADFVCANFANADMVGHTGNLPAAVIACEALDMALGEIWKSIQKHCARLIVTSDHGNAEILVAPDGTPDTEHNGSPVPFCLAGNIPARLRLRNNGALADIAPTILKLLRVRAPEQMTGESLVRIG
jgi:2,3-bisphosphoglycerate-independent phosphoglycerate mutase